jgi:hypothetical protein
VIESFLPLRVVSEANRREHWAVRSRRVKQHRDLARLAITCQLMMEPLYDVFDITLIRIIGPRGRRLDSDNLCSAFKAVRDGVADALAINDGSQRLTWRYAQECGPDHGVKILITGRKNGTHNASNA